MTRIERFALWCFDYLADKQKLIVSADIERLAWEQCIFLKPGDSVRALRKLGYGGFVELKWALNKFSPFPESFYPAYSLTERGMNQLWKIPLNPWDIFTEEEK